MTTFEQQLLDRARRMPEAEHALKCIGYVHDVWRGALNEPELDRDKFTAKILKDGERYAIEDSLGMAFDPVWLASVIVACVPWGGSVTFEQVKALRKVVAEENARIVAKVADVRSREEVKNAE